MSYKNVNHVIFDLDGTLIETESVYNKVMSEIAGTYGKSVDFGLRMKILGTIEPVSAKLMVEELGLPLSVEEFLKIYRKRTSEELTNPKLMPGAVKLVEHLANHGIPIAIATSSAEDSMVNKTQNHKKFFSLFHHVVCGTTDPDVKAGKPAPDIFLVCASRFPDSPEPSQCLVFEDAPNGIKGAKAAGMQGILIPFEEIGEDTRKDATMVINSLLDFKPELFGLPPFEESRLFS